MENAGEPDFPVVAFLSISFTHHTAILSQVKSYEERKFYIQFAADYKVKSEDLEQLMKDGLYNHQGQLPNNFKKTIPDQLLAYRTIAMFKDEYLLDYINTEELFVRDKDRDEKLIEQGIINNVKNFIMTFGKDFTFVGNQYHLEKIWKSLYSLTEMAKIAIQRLQNNISHPTTYNKIALGGENVGKEGNRVLP